MEEVDEVTEVSFPPIIPAKATALLSSEITRQVSSRTNSWSSSKVKCSFFLANLTDISPLSLSRSKACKGCPNSKSI